MAFTAQEFISTYMRKIGLLNYEEPHPVGIVVAIEGENGIDTYQITDITFEVFSSEEVVFIHAEPT